MANSVGMVYIDDPLAVPKTLKAAHSFWSDLPMIALPNDVRILCVRVRIDRGDPPQTFEDVYSGHDCFGLTFLPGVEGTGITVCQFDAAGSGSPKQAKVKTRQGGLTSVNDTPLNFVPGDEEDLVMFNSDVVVISYGVLETDFEDLLAEAKTIALPPPT